jgi:hypothetical protein
VLLLGKQEMDDKSVISFVYGLPESFLLPTVIGGFCTNVEVEAREVSSSSVDTDSISLRQEDMDDGFFFSFSVSFGCGFPSVSFFSLEYLVLF